MFAYYKSQNKSLIDKLNEIYKIYGYCLNKLHNYTFKGLDGKIKMDEIMKNLRNGLTNIGGINIEETIDYKDGIDDLPKINVLKYKIKNNSSVIIRPSGTEPKMKVYMSISAKDEKEANEIENILKEGLEKYLIRR